MFQCCGRDKLFSTLKTVKQHISSSVKTRTNSLTQSATGRRAVLPAGPGGAESEARRDPSPLERRRRTLSSNTFIEDCTSLEDQPEALDFGL